MQMAFDHAEGNGMTMLKTKKKRFMRKISRYNSSNDALRLV